MKLSTMTLSIECRCAECRDYLNVNAKCHYAQCHYAECRYAECRYAECRGASATPKAAAKLELNISDHLPAQEQEQQVQSRLAGHG